METFLTAENENNNSVTGYITTTVLYQEVHVQQGTRNILKYVST